MFVDLDWPLNASSLLSASAELLVNNGNGVPKRPPSKWPLVQTASPVLDCSSDGKRTKNSYCQCHRRSSPDTFSPAFMELLSLDWVSNVSTVRFSFFAAAEDPCCCWCSLECIVGYVWQMMTAMLQLRIQVPVPIGVNHEYKVFSFELPVQILCILLEYKYQVPSTIFCSIVQGVRQDSLALLLHKIMVVPFVRG